MPVSSAMAFSPRTAETACLFGHHPIPLVVKVAIISTEVALIIAVMIGTRRARK